MAKKISKKTFTIFVVLAILVLVGFLFYSFNKRSNLFEGLDGVTAPVTTDAVTTAPVTTAPTINQHYPGNPNIRRQANNGSCEKNWVTERPGSTWCKWGGYWAQAKADCNDREFSNQKDYDTCVNDAASY